ncbi:unnamed protein product [Prunus armeniaca]
MMFPNLWTQSDVDWSKKLDNSGSFEVRSEMEWLVYCIVLAIGFHSNSPNDSSHDIMMFPNLWTQSDVDWSKKLDNSGSFEVRSEMEWLVYCTVLAIGFHSKLTNDSSNNITMFPKFCTQSDTDWSTKLDNSASYEVRSKIEWWMYCTVLEIGIHSKLTK